MKKPKFFISGDWGTTNFRLRVVETDSLKVLFEHQTDQGIKVLYQQFIAQSHTDQFQFFSQYLLEQIQALPSEHQNHLLILSGMASANIGMFEMDYAEMPFGKNGHDLVKKHFTLPNGSEVLLISGARSQAGMMRGEEIQALGLADQLDQYGNGILLLPGTHSKHILYEKGQYADLKTFMTGELFELLSQKSILENNVTSNAWSEERKQSFLEGVELGASGKMTASLFSIRARHLLQNSEKEDNFYLLSGLLIGDELSYLKNENAAIFLAAPSATENLYQLAFQHIAPDHQLIIFKNEVIENALLEGQRKMLSLHE